MQSLTAKSFSRGIVKDIIIVAVGVLVIWLGLQVVFGTPNPFYVVSSGSMIPELQVFDILVVNGNDPFEEIESGDVIVFNRPSGHDRVIVHRVVSIIDNDPLTVRTKGDANPASIPGTDFPITEEEYIGQVAYVVPQAGYITRVLTPPINYIIIALIAGIMVAKHLSKKKREKASSINDIETEDSTDEDDISTGWTDVPKDIEYSESKGDTAKDSSESSTDSENAEHIESVKDSKENSADKDSQTDTAEESDKKSQP